jgi:hypothetical protein
MDQLVQIMNQLFMTKMALEVNVEMEADYIEKGPIY